MVDAVIWTEGKTDTQYLARASKVLEIPHALNFPVSNDMGDDQLLKQCIALSRVSQERPTIFVFDRDNPDFLSKICDADKPYKAWGNNVFSCAIPIPDHRPNANTTCIELYFCDEDLAITEADGRRLFLSSEFNQSSGRHLTDPRLSVAKYPLNDEGIEMDIAEFYTQWATALKLKIELDPIKEMLRQQKYKELSDQAINLLHGQRKKDSHRWHHLLAQCQFNKWEYGPAKISIDNAIAALPHNSYLRNPYERLRDEIVKKALHYQRRR